MEYQWPLQRNRKKRELNAVCLKQLVFKSCLCQLTGYVNLEKLPNLSVLQIFNLQNEDNIAYCIDLLGRLNELLFKALITVSSTHKHKCFLSSLRYYYSGKFQEKQIFQNYSQKVVRKIDSAQSLMLILMFDYLQLSSLTFPYPPCPTSEQDDKFQMSPILV